MLKIVNGEYVDMTQAEIDVYNASLPTVADAIAAKLEQLDNKATEVEEQGITVGGNNIATDLRAQLKLTSGVTFFSRNPTLSKRVKLKSNGFINTDKATVEAMQDALSAHLDSVAANHEIHYNAINAINALLTKEEVIAYDINTGWPAK